MFLRLTDRVTDRKKKNKGLLSESHHFSKEKKKDIGSLGDSGAERGGGLTVLHTRHIQNGSPPAKLLPQF